MFFPPFLLVEFKALDMDHSSFFHLTRVWLLLHVTRFLAFTTWSSHSPGIPLWQPRSHLGLGPRNMKQSLNPFTRYVYITFSFPLQHSYSRLSYMNLFFSFLYICKWILMVRFRLSLHTFLETSMFLLYLRTHMIFLHGIGRLMSTLLEFDFAHIFLAFDWAILLFHSNDLKVLKEVKSYLENNGF